MTPGLSSPFGRIGYRTVHGAQGCRKMQMKQLTDLLGSAAERVRRSVYKRRHTESYGELIWLMGPQAAPYQLLRPWRQELDSFSVTRITRFVDTASHNFLSVE